MMAASSGPTDRGRGIYAAILRHNPIQSPRRIWLGPPGRSRRGPAMNIHQKNVAAAPAATVKAKAGKPETKAKATPPAKKPEAKAKPQKMSRKDYEKELG